MKFIVLNRDQVEHYRPIENHIVISVKDPDQEWAKLPKNSFRLNALFLAFSDVDDRAQKILAETPEEDKKWKVVPFTQLHAKLILDCFNRWKDKINLVVVNCEAGICRSSAIAAALAKINGQDDSEFFKRYLPNSLVYRLILEEYNK